jgi:hypothetical protein
MFYYIYGLNKATKEKVLLFNALTKERAIMLADAFLREGDWPMISVRYETQVDVTWDGDPVIEEVIVYSCYSEPMDIIYN